MNVLIISQCSKRALVETRRIVDQFAERKGERTWQTTITWEGLLTLRKLLRKIARRNTAVVCHWIKANNRTEILWFVGNAGRFNEQGTIPTNTTARNVLRAQDENQWHTAEEIALLGGIAGLFHDFGKANILFQQKLAPGQRGNIAEPYRHDWVSLRLFQAFVGQLGDREWLQKLKDVTAGDEAGLLEGLSKDGLENPTNPFKPLPPLARTVAWLILSHHRLPRCPERENSPQLEYCNRWLEESLNSRWNGSKAQEQEWSPQDIQKVWQFTQGTPLLSHSWRAKARRFAERALRRPQLLSGDWFQDTFTLHLSRLVLMLADHHYSAQAPTPKWQDHTYRVYANTYRETKQYKQVLDEHLIGVGINSLLLAKTLPTLRQTLPTLARHKGFKKRNKLARFRWQDKAYELAASLQERSEQHGFFGVDMASTGCGKTFANGRIMYGLANETHGCRFNIALGLRTLTLQTGDALRRRLRLEADDLAVMIGSQAVSELHEFHHTEEKIPGSESAEDLLDDHQYVSYEGALDDGRISRWLERSPQLHKMVSAPILVSTIDHLIPATEGERGGKQIAPMLRLLTSDLVLDEPDNFDLADLPALARLVNWAAMLGSRVLLSSATLPPALIKALFAAYLAGRHHYQQAIGEPGRTLSICCAWFNEHGVAQSEHREHATFADAHQRFVQGRVAHLKKQPPVRRGQLLPLRLAATTNPRSSEAVISSFAQTLYSELHTLHRYHHQAHPETGQWVSVGLIRLANIDPLAALAQHLVESEPQANHRIHYCVYHSQHPLAVRSDIERELDAVLTRHDPEALWQQPAIKNALRKYPEENHLFVVLATPIAEVERDHDYDWAIAEPSSMRSLIQLAGCIQRHRPPKAAEHPNLSILIGNIRALRGEPIAYTKPGFESKNFKLRHKNLERLLKPEQYQSISALPRIMEAPYLQPATNLVDLEHAHLHAQLFGSRSPRVPLFAALWWQQPLNWNFELQRRTPFRASPPEDSFVLYLEDEAEEPEFRQRHNGELKGCKHLFEKLTMEPAAGVSIWGHRPFADIAWELAEARDMEPAQVSRRYGTLQLPQSQGTERWRYHPVLGVHGRLKWEMIYPDLSRKIAEYIETRAQDKLEKFDKEAEKERQAVKNETELAELNKELTEKRQQEQARFAPANWLTEAARRASQIQPVTHALKFTHTDAKGTSIYAPAGGSNCPFLSEGATLHTAALANVAVDMVGNAAALDVGKLLQLEDDNGQTLIEALQQGDDSALAPFSTSPEQLQQWMEGFHKILENKAPSSHPLAKQLFFPVTENDYHLLAPLHSSPFSQALFSRITATRFSEEAKAAREARRKKQHSDTEIIEFPQIAVQNFGGTKPQNVSQLNSARRGRAFLLSCAPPRWRSQSRPPLNIDNVINGPYGYRVRRQTRDLQRFLLSQVGKDSVNKIRTERAQRIDHLIEELLQFGAEIQSHPEGWSADKACALPLHQQLWLDPGRAKNDSAFAQEREKNDWPQQVADDFSLWLNRKLQDEKLAMGEVEHREWKSLVAQKLRLLKANLEVFAQ